MYHGSEKLLTSLKPHPHYLSPNKPVVFGTPYLGIAMAFLQPWTDEMLELGIVGDDPPYLIEMYRGAFKDIYAKKAGYIYDIDPSSFIHTPTLANFEAISYKKPKIINIYKVEDALKALKKSDIQMILYKDSDKFRKNSYCF